MMPRGLGLRAALACLLAFAALGCLERDPEAVWNEAESAFNAGKYDHAQAAMDRLARLREPTPSDHLMRARLLMVRDRTDDALAELAAVPDASPLAAQARLKAGQLELRRDRARIAERYFLDAIRLQPDLVNAHRERIYILGFELRRPELAEAFRRLNAVAPLAFQEVFLWCLTRGVMWEPGEAADKLARWLAADPEDHWARLGLAQMLRRLSRFDEAEAALAPLTDDDPEARTLRAELALDRGDDKAAEALLAGGPKVHLGLGLLRGRMAIAREDFPKAVAAFRDALAAEPNNRDAVFGLAHALQRAGEPEAPRFRDLSARHERLGTLVQRAAQANAATDVKLIHELGAACAAVGRLPEARAWYAIAVKIDPFDSEAQQALFRLKDDAAPTS